MLNDQKREKRILLYFLFSSSPQKNIKFFLIDILIISLFLKMSVDAFISLGLD